MNYINESFVATVGHQRLYWPEPTTGVDPECFLGEGAYIFRRALKLECDKQNALKNIFRKIFPCDFTKYFPLNRWIFFPQTENNLEVK